MMGGAFGYELDLTKLSEKELDEISQQIETYHSIRETIQFGQLYRLKRRAIPGLPIMLVKIRIKWSLHL